MQMLMVVFGKHLDLQLIWFYDHLASHGPP